MARRAVIAKGNAKQIGEDHRSGRKGTEIPRRHQVQGVTEQPEEGRVARNGTEWLGR